jgi:hypothetical protein
VSINGRVQQNPLPAADLAKPQEGENRTDDDNKANDIHDGIHRISSKVEMETGRVREGCYTQQEKPTISLRG